MNTPEKLTARNCGYLIQEEMKRQHGMIADRLQLQKLTYICFGYYGGATEKYLFDDRIEAWQYGPVVPVLYHQGVDKVTDAVKKNMETTVKTVINYYGRLNSLRLVGLTHSQDTPWSDVYQEGKKYTEIPKDLILHYYRSIFKGMSFMNKSGLLDELAKT